MADIASQYVKIGAARSDIEALLQLLPVRVVPIDERLSYEAEMFRPVTLKVGLSLGDRYCLALTKREGVPAVTAERRWPDIAAAVGVTVDLIR